MIENKNKISRKIRDNIIKLSIKEIRRKEFTGASKQQVVNEIAKIIEQEVKNGANQNNN